MAFTLLSDSIARVVPRSTCILSSCFFTRVDLTVQLTLDIPVWDLLSVMRHVPHSNRWPCVYENKNVTYGNNKAQTQVVLYDKRLKRDGVIGNILRVEVRLRKQDLKNALGDSPDRFPSNLSFDRCYQAFRSVISGFSPSSVPLHTLPGKSAFLPALVSLAEDAGLTFPDGRSPLDVHRTLFGGQAHRQLRRRVTSDLFLLRHFDWASEFPESWPPRRLATHVPDAMEQYLVARQIFSRPYQPLSMEPTPHQ